MDEQRMAELIVRALPALARSFFDRDDIWYGLEQDYLPCYLGMDETELSSEEWGELHGEACSVLGALPELVTVEQVYAYLNPARQQPQTDSD